jgi:streptogrisin C
MLATASPATAGPAPAGPGGVASTDVLTALQRDLRLSPAQARARLAMDVTAGSLEQSLRASLGAKFGGAWINPAGDQVVVAVTDAAAATAAASRGARVQLVQRGEAELTAVKDRLDGQLAAAPAGVTGWYVDVASNTVVVEALPSATSAARAFVGRAGAPAAAVRVATTAEQPRTLYHINGGDAYYMGGRCSVGFSVNGGFVTAGHCGRPGTATQGYNRVAQGTFAGSSFPGDDYAWVRTNGSWEPRGWVAGYNGQWYPVRGSSESPVGAAICRSGSTTGLRCGTVQAKNQTVRYPQGAVAGLTRTNACAEPGDSGGAWLTHDQAQGVTSGGSGNCRTGGTTYFQPINEILSRYGLTLVRA